MSIKEARDAKGFNQKEIASALGVSQPTVSDWEAGRKMPTRKNLLRLAELLDSSVDSLLGVEKRNAPSDSEIKFALFGEEDIDDDLYEEVRRFAQYAKMKKNEEHR